MLRARVLLRAACAALALVLAALVAACGGADREPAAAPRVGLALDFAPNAVHAPLFAAVRRGHDREHGIQLAIRRPGSGPDSLKLVAAGRLDLGVLDIHDLALARARGVDLVAVAALVRRPLAALVARDDVPRPRALEGRTVGVSGLPSDPAFLRAVVEHDGGRPERVRQVTIGFNAVANLLAGRIDAAPVFWNAEGVALRRRGARVREFRVEDFGAPPYPEVVLVTARSTLERRRDRLVRAVRAVRAGLASTLADEDAAARQVAREAQADLDLVRAQLRAVRPALSRDLRLDRGVLERWADFDVRIGILPRRPDVEQAFDPTVAG